MPPPAGVSGGSADDVLVQVAAASVDELLEIVRRYAGVAVAFVGEFSGGRRIIRFVEGEGTATARLVGRSHELGASYCQLIASGAIPTLVDDVSQLRELRQLKVTAELDIASYIGVPIRLSDGELFGTLCGIGNEPCHEWPPGLTELLHAAAAVIAQRLEAPRHRFLDVLATQDRIQAVLEEPAAFSIVYQPIVELDSGAVVGHEALSRFPGRAQEPPDAWFADAHAVGLGVALEVLAARRAIEGYDWGIEGFLSVNLSASALLEAPLDPLVDGIDAGRLVVELTENQPDEGLLPFHGREELRRRGVRLAVDDLGAGFAGLSRVIEIHPEIVKLDRFLTSGVSSDPRRTALAAAVLHVCQALGIDLVAEGIATRADRDALLALGVPLGQGFLFGRPAPLPQP